jgi:hypothetical protein
VPSWAGISGSKLTKSRRPPRLVRAHRPVRRRANPLTPTSVRGLHTRATRQSGSSGRTSTVARRGASVRPAAVNVVIWDEGRRGGKPLGPRTVRELDSRRGRRAGVHRRRPGSRQRNPATAPSGVRQHSDLCCPVALHRTAAIVSASLATKNVTSSGTCSPGAPPAAALRRTSPRALGRPTQPARCFGSAPPRACLE